MKIGNLETGRELTQEELTDWLIQRTRFLMGRDLSDRKPEEFQEEVKEFTAKINTYKSEEMKLIEMLKKQVELRDQEIENLKRQLHNTFRMLDSAERRQGEEIQKSNELRKRLVEVTRDMGNPGQTT